MSEMLFTSSVAQATEVMHALLSDNLDAWSAKRLNSLTGEPISGIWGDCYEKATGKFFLKRISEFSATLKNVRIMKVVPKAIPSQDVYGKRSGTLDAQMERVVEFHLGVEKNSSQIVVRIIFECEEEYTEDRDLWGPWWLCYTEAITCLKHPDPKLTNYVILGLSALD